MTITKAHVTDSIHKGLGLPKNRSSAVVGSLFEIMKVTLENGEDILRALKNAPFRSLRLSASRLGGTLHSSRRGGTRNIQYIPVVNPAKASRYKRD